MSRSALVVLAAAFGLAHLPFVTSTLEDIDSVNFALGLRDFDVATHRPHPPGYPLYVAVGKLVRPMVQWFSDGGLAASAIDARTLSLMSLVGSLAAILLAYRVLSGLSATPSHDEESLATPWRRLDVVALAATALTTACPLFWYLAVRPMSDMPGLAVALAAQACLMLAWWRQRPDRTGDRRLTPARVASSGAMIVAGALLAAVAMGFRSQNAMLTLPLLAGVLVDRIGRGVAGALIGSAAALLVGMTLWVVPLLWASGGLNAYLAALGSQAGEDFAGVDMVYLNPGSPRLVGFALLRTFVYPWDSMTLGVVVTVLAVVGALMLLRHERRTLVAVSLAAGPYLVFHALFHDTTFVRYALPVVPFVVYLAVRGVAFWAGRAALPLVGGLAIWAMTLGSPVLARYGSESSPVARAVEQMNAQLAVVRPEALAFHQTFRRPLEAEVLRVTPVLASPPRREWLELTQFWRERGPGAVWFLADPRRTDLHLIDPQSRQDFTDLRWGYQSLSNLGGMRPDAVRWYRLTAPGWFAEQGWALTPETAGMARVMGQGPSHGPITAWVRRRPAPVRLLVGGRHLGGPNDPPVRFALEIDGRSVFGWEARPGFFLETFEVPDALLVGEGFARLTIHAVSDAPTTAATAIEQFDLQSRDHLLWGYDEGWHEAEYAPEIGVWRWTSNRASLRIVGATEPVQISMRVERPRRYFDDDPVVRLLAGTDVLGQTTFTASENWTITVPVEALARANGRLTFDTTRTFVPAERGEGPDRRALGLRVFDVRVSPQH